MTSSDAPLKPFTLNLNSFFSLRIFSAEKIFLKFSAKKFEKKFRLEIKADQVMTSSSLSRVCVTSLLLAETRIDDVTSERFREIFNRYETENSVSL